MKCPWCPHETHDGIVCDGDLSGLLLPCMCRRGVKEEPKVVQNVVQDDKRLN